MKQTLVVTFACLLLLIVSAEAKEHKGAKQSRDQNTEMPQERSQAGKRKVGDGDGDDSDTGYDGDSDSGGKSNSSAGAKGKSGSDADSDMRGNEQSAEMRARRDERKEIQEEYRSDREPGQEGDKAEGKGAKKPWYKFWE